MPAASIVLDFSILKETRKIRAVTHGNGIYEKSLLPPDPGYVDSDPDKLLNPLVQAGNYPNPFCEETTISFFLVKPSRVTLDIYDVAGRLVKKIPARMYRNGQTEIKWDGRNGDGEDCPSGIYFGVISTPGGSSTLSMLRIQ